MLNLEPIKARWAKTTESPWHYQIDTKAYFFRIFDKRHNRIAFAESICDAEAIAQAPEDVFSLVTEVERLRARLEELEAIEALEKAIWRKCILDDEELGGDLNRLNVLVNELHKEAIKDLDWIPGKPINWGRYNAES
jgi:hypothetical protein